jgi:hypothetical protein
VQAAIAEAVQLMFFHTFNKDERKAELESLLRDCYGTLFGMVADGDRETQIGSSLTILKLIQLSMVPKYSGVYDLLLARIIQSVTAETCKVTPTLLEALLFLNKSHSDIGPIYVEAVVNTMLKMLRKRNEKVKKIAIDNLWLITILNGSEVVKVTQPITKDADAILEAVDELRSAKDKGVRDSAAQCVAALKELTGDDGQFRRQTAANENERRSSGQKVDGLTDGINGRSEGPLGEEAMGAPSKGKGRKPQRTQHVIDKPKKRPSTKVHTEEETSKKEPKPKSKEERVPIKKREMNPDFVRHSSQGVEVLVTYDSEQQMLEDPVLEEANEGDGDELEAYQTEEADEYCEDPDATDPTNEQPTSQRGHRGQLNERAPFVSFGPDYERGSDRAWMEYRPKEKHGTKAKEAKGKRRTGHTHRREEVETSEGDERGTGLEAERRATEEFRSEEMGCQYDHLRQEYQTQEKLIDYQNDKIDNLVSHVSALTSNLQSVMQKASHLEHNLQQITYHTSMPQPPFQYQTYPAFVPYPTSMPVSHGYPVYHAQGLPKLDVQNTANFSFEPRQTTIAATPQLSFRTDTEFSKLKDEIEYKRNEISVWKEKRAQEERKLRDKFNALNEARKDMQESTTDRKNKGQYAYKITGESYFPEERSARSKVAHTASNKFKGKNELSQQSLHEELNNLRVREEVETRQLEEALLCKAKEKRSLNTHLQKLLLENEPRRLIDFLEDGENLRQFGELSASNIERLASRVTDLLSFKVETYIEVCVPWVHRLIASGSLRSAGQAADLAYVVSQILSGDRNKKVYQFETLRELQALARDLKVVVQRLNTI